MIVPPRPRLARGALLLLSLALAAGGCGTPHSTLPDAGGGTLVLGTGSPLFIPVVDGDRVEIIHGPQGGYHIWGSLLCRGLGNHLTLSFTLTRLDDNWLANTVSTTALVMPMSSELLSLDGGHDGTDGGAFTFALPPGDGEWGIAPGSLVFVPDPAELAGRRVRMSVTATSDEGQSASDSRIFIARMP